jgi:Baseplate J-like protein
MSVAAPQLDPRTYQELVDEALARIPVHNPEWTNFNQSDPGVTLLELFAFMTESLLYRANQIPERNRLKFLNLLGVPLAPASSARGIVVLANEKGPPDTVTLNNGIEVLAGSIPFRTEAGLDVLPVEGRAYVKQRVLNPPDEILAYYETLYASYTGPHPSVSDVKLYDATPLDRQGSAGVSLKSTVDGSLWIALFLRKDDAAANRMQHVREALAGKTLNLGLVPVIDDPNAKLQPGGASTTPPARLDYQLPSLPPNALLPSDPSRRVAQYRSLSAAGVADPLAGPAVVQITLPATSAELGLWSNLDPLEDGVGEFPPALDDPELSDRVVTWLRVKAPAGAQLTVLWAGINAVTVSQRSHVAGEILPVGTGEPDQAVRLSRTPIIPESLVVTVNGEPWQETDDLLTAGPEVPVPDPREPPGSPAPPSAPSAVFAVDGAGGVVTFGDGVRGARPPAGATLRADYDYGAGSAGNVAAGQIATAPGLPAGITVTNPVRTWGGAEAESVPEAEKQASRYLQHRDRLVAADDFESIVWRTPGVDLGRVDVLPAFSPELAPSQAGDAAGAVTVLVVPKYDAVHPDAPEPDQILLDAICDWLDPRRLVTTEIFLRGPTYVDISLSVGFEAEAGSSIATVRDTVAAELRRFLAPVDPTAAPWWDETSLGLEQPFTHVERGWPLGKAVVALELMAVISRVPGVRLVNGVLLAAGSSSAVDSVDMTALQLPRLANLSVVAGPPIDLGAVPPDATPPTAVPVPVVPDTC